MATYGVSFYGVGLYGPEDSSFYTPAEYSAAPFTAKPQGYGTVRLEWSMPTAPWSELRIIRSTSGAPDSVDDGTTALVLDTHDTVSYSLDYNLDTGRWYYYTIFIYDPTAQVWVASASAKCLVPADYGYAARLWDLLPVPFKSTDLEGVGNAELPDNQQLYQFLQVFGFAFDTIRTQADSLLKLPNPRVADESVLAAALAQYGFDYEPQLGATAMRKLLRNAVHLYQTKGTATGAADLVATLTGWRTSATTGKNLALDNVQAGMAGGIGQWGQFINNVTTHWRTSGGALVAPAGDGILDAVVATPTEVVQVGPTDALQGIPITPGQQYTVSIYARVGAGVAGTWSARLAIGWVNMAGSALATTAATVDITADGNWHRIVATGTPPAGAVFGLPALGMNGTANATVGQEFYWAGFQLEQASAVTGWECARKLWLTVEPDLINEVPNPSGRTVSPSTHNTTGWAAAHGTLTTEFEVDTDDGTANFLYTEDGYTTDVQQISCTAGRVAVDPGQTWTLVAEVKGDPADWLYVAFNFLQDDFTHYGNTATARLVPSSSWQTVSLTFTVPDDPEIAILEPALQLANTTTGHELRFRRVTMVQAAAAEAFSFDAGDSSATQDFAWEGTPYASRSMYFAKRAVKVARLQEIVPRFLPADRCWGIAYAPGEPTTAP